nr:PREDICTED: thymidine kinase 2, mitochondrial-like [Bemisia tabaci]
MYNDEKRSVESEDDTFSFSEQGPAKNTRKQKVVVFVKGNIGSGKSTLLKALQEFSIFTDIQLEPVDIWQNYHGTNVLDLYYENPSRYGFFFPSLIQSSMRNSRRRHGDFSVHEHSLHICTKVFLQYAETQNWGSLFSKGYNMPLSSAATTAGSVGGDIPSRH